jgi:hypothetical protein
LLHRKIDLGERDAITVAVCQVLNFNHSPGLSRSINP